MRQLKQTWDLWRTSSQTFLGPFPWHFAVSNASIVLVIIEGFPRGLEALFLSSLKCTTLCQQLVLEVDFFA